MTPVCGTLTHTRLRESLGINDGDFVVVVPEPDVRSCGQFETFWAVALRHYLTGQMRVVVPGESSETRRIQRVRKTLPREGAVIRPDPHIPFRELLSVADALVSAPRSDVSPTPVEWAMEAGCLVVGTDVGRLGTLIDHDVTGLLFTPVPGKRMFTQILTHLDNSAVHPRLRAAAKAARR